VTARDRVNCDLHWRARMMLLLVDDNLHSPQRRLIELRMEHADLDSLIDRLADEAPIDDLAVRRLKKRRLLLRDQIARLEAQVDPPEPA
jgi:hypothetical protein